ncbi:MAG: BspA family leucine-rich repeat surface protein [Ekhidna sp.]|nr:BspA family leucine-rich repeat surface protein [Ekhidna sp.]
MELAFAGCRSLTIAEEAGSPNLSNVTDMSHMFSGAAAFNGDLSEWDVSSVTNMSSMFFRAAAFNGDLSEWDVSKVTTMSYMFFEAAAFNQDLSEWNVSKVTSMGSMFSRVAAFNQDLSEWDVSKVTTMSYMFSEVAAFNQDLSEWDVSSVTTMSYMFNEAAAFNGDLSEWNVSKVTDMSRMFSGAAAFNGDLSEWDVSKVTTMSWMFSGAAAFNQDLSEWDVSSVTTMSSMFGGAAAFNQDLSEWNVSSVTDMRSMFSGVAAFNQDLSEWNVSSVTTMVNMFSGARAFNQDLSEWDVSSVTDMRSMFSGVAAFNQDLSEWDVSSVTDMEGMFNGAAAFNQDLSGWDVSSVTDMNNMFSGNTSISSENYDALLIGWSTLDTEAGETQIPSDISFGAPKHYTCAGEAAREKLTRDKRWDIWGDELAGVLGAEAAPLPEVPSPCRINVRDDLTVPTVMSCSGQTIRATTLSSAFTTTGSHTVTWMYRDSKGNTATQTQEVIITDEAPMPVANRLTALTAACSLAEADLTEPTATDNCDGNITATSDVTTFPITSNTSITWTFTDKAGNTATQTQTVTITACPPEESKPLSATDDAVEAVVFPNPSGRYMEVQSPVESPIRILSVGGELVLKSTTNTKIDAASLHSGLYLIQLPDGHLLKFVKR